MAFQVPIRRGEKHPFAKIPDSARIDCRSRWLNNEATITELAKENSVAKPTMHRIVHDPHWNKADTPSHD